MVLHGCLSNPRKPLCSLISCVHKVSKPRGVSRPVIQRADTRRSVIEKSRQFQTHLNASNRAVLFDSYSVGVPVRELVVSFGVHRGMVSELVRRVGHGRLFAP